MKETLIAVLQQRMDKCTSEQFWACATLSGLNVFLLLQKDLVLSVPAGLWFGCSAVVILTAYGTFFIIHRHISYYKLQDSLISLLDDEEEVPQVFIRPGQQTVLQRILRSILALSGVTFYAVWPLVLAVFNIMHMLC